MKRFFWKNALWFLLVLTCMLPTTAQAAIITYAVQDFAATALDGVSGDVWQYTYYVSGLDADADVGFTIYFDAALCSHVQTMDDVLTENGQWSQLTWDPDPALPDDGAYDALSLADGASLSDPFSVSFIWLGGDGQAPGSQAFEIYDLDTGEGAFGILETGTTSPVPEPATLFLFGAGLLALARGAGKRR